MAKLNFEYYVEQNTVNGDSVQCMIANIIKEKRGIDNLREEETTFSTLYHLSKVRQNLLLWYDFKEDAKILEIGSGCGTMTGFLCRKAAYVVSLESSKEFAMLNYEQNQCHDNLEIVVGNIADISSEWKFDYVVLNNVLVHAPQYVNSTNPYVDFIKQVSGLLNEDGRILLSTKNRLGSKYFSGTPEENTGTYFFGINGFTNDDSVCMFSKTELQELCAEANMSCARFYYPYPDLEFPSEIFTDETINTDLYGKEYFQFSERRLSLIDEPKLLKTMAKENVADVFANSFLVEITKVSKCKQANCLDRNIQYVKLNTDRSEAFQIYTVVYEQNGKKRVDKCAISSDSKHHLRNMYEYGLSNHGEKWNALAPLYNEEKGILTYPWVESESYSEKVTRYVSEENVEMIINLLKEIQAIFLDNAICVCPYKNKNFRRVFCDNNESAFLENDAEEFLCVEAGNIDIILSNIFQVGDTACVIDYEWFFDFPIPVQYIMWRIIDALYNEHRGLVNVLGREELEKLWGISKEQAVLFRKWENSFVYDYVGCNKLEKFLKTPLQPNLVEIANRLLAERVSVMKLYVDDGEGFSENHVLEQSVEIRNGRFEVEFELEYEWQCLRFDPTDYACKVSELKVSYDNQDLFATPMNAYVFDGYEIFLKSDPNYLITKENSVKVHKDKRLVVTGYMELLSTQMLDEYQMRAFEEQDRIKREEFDLRQAIEEKERHIINQDGQILDLRQAVEEKEQHIMNQDEQIRVQAFHLNEQKRGLDSQAIQLVELNEEKQKLLNELGAIKGSRLYKLYEIKDKVKNRLLK